VADLNGRPLLDHVLESAASARGIRRVVVTLGARADEILAAIDLRGAEPVLVPEWEEGQAASLRAGVAALADDADAAVILLGDQPFITKALIEAAAAAWSPGCDAVRTTFEGRPGHPVVLSRTLFPAVGRLRGDVGAKRLLADANIVELPGALASVADVDTPAELAAARERLTRPHRAG
jgi:CTP:molybdopterin cytidylyltransferase MocA